MNTAKEPIAIIGLSSLFPDAENLQQFWSNIFRAADAISEVPDSHWKLDDYYDPDPSAEDKTYCRHGGFVPRTSFSPVEFGIPPNALDVIDILQLLSLNVAKSLLHNAGYLAPQSFETLKERTGVVLGITGANSLTQPLSNRLQYPKIKEVLASRGLNEVQADDIVDTLKKAYAPWEENAFPGMLGNVVAGRIANRFDLGGVNCTVDAACASSLAALRMAIDELQCGRADMMLTGGCDAENTILMYLCFSKTPAFSRRGIISPFDAESDGTLIGEGIGMLALKRLSDAERDGDHIYALIKGLGASSDGKFKSIYAPRKEGQIRCLNRAYQDAGFPIQSVGLLEAHGTGTKLGDATEVSALKEIIGPAETPHIAVGSVKSQIGHTKAAAGAAGLIKTTLSLYHKALPPSINVKQAIEELREPTSPLYLNNNTRPWLLNYGSETRRAGVSAFGFGGTNFHAVLEEYLPPSDTARHRLHSVAQPVLVSEDSTAALRTKLEKLSHLDGAGQAWPFEANSGQSHRIGFVAGSLDQLQEKARLAAEHLAHQGENLRWQHPRGIYFSREVAGGRVAALFSGQGSQYVNMGKAATLAYPPYLALLETVDRLMYDSAGEYLSNKIYPHPAYDEETTQQQELTLRQTQYAQPAIGCMSAGAYQTLCRAGFRADCVAGHSFGELTALWAAGALQTEDFVNLAIARGRTMAPQSDQADSGTMAAVSTSGEELERLIKESGVASVYLCNFNTDEQTVIGGAADAMAEFGRFLSKRDINFTPLPVSAAFHTPLVAHAQQNFAEAIDAVDFQSPALPLYRNHDGQAVRDADTLKTGLKQQLLEPVRFVDIVRQMLADGVRTFVEFGPKGHLSKMVRSLCEKLDHTVTVVSLDNGKPEGSAEQLNSALVQLAVAGVALKSLDEFEPDYRDAPQKSGFTVELSGINHVSDNRRRAWREGLNNPADIWKTAEQPRVKAAEVPRPESVTEQPQLFAQPKRELSIVSQQKSNTEITSSPVTAAPQSTGVQIQINAQLEMLGELMRGNADIHQTYLNQVNQTSRQTVSLLDSLNDSFRTDPQRLQSVSELARQGMQIVADGQAYSSDSHKQFLQQTVELASLASGRNDKSSAPPSITPVQMPAMVEPIIGSEPQLGEASSQTSAQATAPAVAETRVSVASETQGPGSVTVPLPHRETEEPSPTPQTNADFSLERLRDVLMRVVAEKTGYPEDVLSPEMDMEADLGIDSIKRVEILSHMHKALPGLTELQPEALTEVRSLQDIINIASREAQQAQISTAAESAAHSPKTAASAPQITETFLQIVSEKTGYPRDVFEMSMSLESDLGIDSIKRVEILGELQKTLNLGNTLDPAALSELSTLGDIIAYIDQVASGAPVADPIAAAETSQAEGTSAMDAQVVAEILLDLVSEKTGYPREVIELDMDLEADLGIDSIKRVEILGGLQSRFPDLPAPSPEVAGELRKLQQILDFLDASTDKTQSPTTPSVNAAPPESVVATLPPIRRHNIGLRQLGPINQLLNCYRSDAKVLLVNSEPEQTLAVTEELQRSGLEVHILSLPNAGGKISGDHIALQSWTEQALVEALSEIPEVDAVVYQHPTVNTTVDNIDDRHDEVQALKHLLLLTKHYKDSLDTRDEGRRAFITLARVDGCLGLADPAGA